MQVDAIDARCTGGRRHVVVVCAEQLGEVAALERVQRALASFAERDLGIDRDLVGARLRNGSWVASAAQRSR